MKRHKGVLERFLEAAQKTGDITLRWLLQKEQIKNSMLSDADIERIAERVLKYISITIDASELVEYIKSLNDSIEDLGR